MARLEAGDAAPDFSLQDADGSTVSLADLAGSTTILYFYPKDDTTGSRPRPASSAIERPTTTQPAPG